MPSSFIEIKQHLLYSSYNNNVNIFQSDPYVLIKVNACLLIVKSIAYQVYINTLCLLKGYSFKQTKCVYVMPVY